MDLSKLIPTLLGMATNQELGDLTSANDLLEPEYYPDPSLIRVRLVNTLAMHEEEMAKHLSSNKATLRALAPYLQILTLSQEKKMGAKVTRKAKSPKIPFERKSIEQIASIIPNILDSPELIKSIHETAETLKTLIRCKKIVIYFVDPAENQIIQYDTEKIFKIEPGSTMAGYAAYSKRHVVSDDIRADPRFPLGIGINDATMKFGLCMPIKTPDDIVIALFELGRDVFDVNFNTHDLRVMLTITSWIGVAVLQHFKYTSLARQHELKSYLQELIHHYHCDKVNLNQAISNMVVFARETIGADECVLYVIVGSQGGRLEVEEYAENPRDLNLLLKKFSRIQLERDGTVLSRVMVEKQTVNIQENFNMLCVPVLCTCNNIIGAIQLKNTSSKRIFLEEDEITLQLFANHISLIIPFLREVDKISKFECQGASIRNLLYHRIKPSLQDREAMKRRSEKLPDNFFTFSWYPPFDDTFRLAELTVNMFNEVLGGSFMMTNNVPRFILTVKNCYRPNAYHNFLHAFTVTHTMANIVRANHYVFNGIERQALMVAALCHDVDHRGYNNSFVQLTNHYLSVLYESSPLENHHFTVAKLIIEQCSLFRHIRKDIYNQLIGEIRQCILATDLSLYFQSRTELVKIADSKAFSFKNPDHRRLIKSLLMTACDLSGQSKPIQIAMKVTNCVYEEFFQQGDAEKRMGYTPLSTMDRDKETTILDNQVQFLNVVVLPCVEIVARIFSSLHPLLEDTRDTLERWKDLLETDRTRTLSLE